MKPIETAQSTRSTRWSCSRGCRALQPEEPSLAMARARLLASTGRGREARAEYERLTSKLAEAPSAYADAALALVAAAA